MPDATQGSIYDLGYRGYDGPRLGRGYALLSLYIHSLRGVFGLGRRTGSKVFPIGLTVLAFIPAVIQLGIGALTESTVEFFHAHSYYGYTQVILALFCAAAAPPLAGRDQQTHTLSLYFSRSLERMDYAMAKFGALATALLALTLAPQVVLFIGNGLAGNDLRGYFADEWTQVVPIVASAVVLCAFIAAISLVIAAQTPRRAYSTVSILAVFMLTWIVSSIVAELTEREIGLAALLLSPFHMMRGFTLFLFGETPGATSPLGIVDYPGWIYLLAAIAWTALAGYLIYRRYEGINA